MRRLYAAFLQRSPALTTLRDYYPAGEPAEAAIVHWWDAVKRCMIEEALRGGQGYLFERLSESLGRRATRLAGQASDRSARA
jgi:hypothetical protein